ncbi:MAG: serine/threonine-protein kinase [Bradymonadaceae bacterium]
MTHRSRQPEEGGAQADSAVGERVDGRFHVTDHLASGGYGEILSAVDEQHDREVALKTLRTDEQGHDSRALARMRQEAELLQALDHPNLVRVWDLVDTGDREFLVMELLRGPTVDELIASSGPADPALVRELAGQLLSALAAMHDEGVTHRDIKPENILVDVSDDGSPVAKLVDFGVAKAQEFVDSNQEHTLVETTDGDFVGTPRYASPEQAVGDPVGPPSDLFSLGLVVAEWLTGTPRVEGEDQRGIVSYLIQPEPVDVSDCPDSWHDWLGTMLAKGPDDRFETARDAREALREVPVEGQPSLDTLPRSTADTTPPALETTQSGERDLEVLDLRDGEGHVERTDGEHTDPPAQHESTSTSRQSPSGTETTADRAPSGRASADRIDRSPAHRAPHRDEAPTETDGPTTNDLIWTAVSAFVFLVSLAIFLWTVLL